MLSLSKLFNTGRSVSRSCLDLDHDSFISVILDQVNQFLISRTADIGFTSKSVVLSPKMKSLGTWSDINTDDYSPIRQGVIVIDRKKGHMKQAEEFVIFLLSDKAKDILELYGYITDVNP